MSQSCGFIAMPPKSLGNSSYSRLYMQLGNPSNSSPTGVQSCPNIVRRYPMSSGLILPTQRWGTTSTRASVSEPLRVLRAHG